MPRVLVTDYAWPSLDIERRILGEVGAELVVAETGEPDELVSLADGCDAILTNWKKVPPGALDVAPGCLVVSRYGVGLDNIPVEHATELGILVVNVPDFCLHEVSDHAMALVLACARRVARYARETREGMWRLDGPGLPRLSEQTLGLVGFGNIARAVARRAAGFDLKLLAYDPYLPREVFRELGVRQVPLAQVLQDSDFVSLHVPLLPGTHHLIGAPEFALMKRDAILINTCRGPVVDEQALIQALESGQILGAGLDVTEKEPIDADNPLLKMPNVVVTPHMASASDWAGAERRRRPAYEVAAVLTGHRPRAVWNPEVLERVNLK